MTLPLVLPLKLTDLHAEFSAPDGTPLSAFVKDGLYVPINTDNVNVPIALPLALTDFFGASQTIEIVLSVPPNSDTNFPVNTLIDGGIHNTGSHSGTSPTIQTDEKFVIDVTLRLDTDHADGPDQAPQLPGYSWARHRGSVILGFRTVPGSDIEINGVQVDFYFTSATTGYLAATAFRRGVIISSQQETTSAGRWQDQPNTDYGSFVIPDGDNAVRLRVTRGEGITSREFSGTTYYELDYGLYIYQREGNIDLWKGLAMRKISGGGSTSDPRYNDDGQLAVAIPRYATDDAIYGLEFESIAGAIGVFEIP